MTKRVLITDKVHPLLQEVFISKGWQVDYDINVSLDMLSNMISNYHGIIINSKIIMDKAMIDRGKSLKFIGRLGSGMEIIDKSYANHKGIVVVNSPEGNRDSVAEHAIGMLLALTNQLIRADQEVRSFLWDREGRRGIELMGKTLGIIGFGHTGSSVAKRLASWGMNIVFHDILPDYQLAHSQSFRRVSIADILQTCDIISLHLPLTSDTYHLVDDDFVHRCREGVIILNTSRGQVIDTRALINGLESGKLGGACLDVFENEKVDTMSADEIKIYEKLYHLPNTIISPHVAGWTQESLQKIARIIAEKLEEAKVL